ncbi:MAG: hypothetical protein II951_12995 [Bacteroidales bacterium]|nr:hypothetical protein [Bacteroidales bacterium]
MQDYNAKLEKLFDRWIERSKQNNERRDATEEQRIIFTKDGLMEKLDESINVAKEWGKSKRRIMFLLKDQPTDWCNDCRGWLKSKRNYNLETRFIRNIANLFWGLWNASPENLCSAEQLHESLEDVKSCFNTHPFAFVECKKQGGGTRLSDKELKSYLNKYGDLLKEEIEILDPNMIVCTNRHIYSFVTKMYEGELTTIDGFNSIRINERRGKLIFCSYHPSARRGEDFVYDGVMNHFRAYLTSGRKMVV